VLTQLSLLIAPFTPFMAEDIYAQLSGKATSVHLQEYPTAQKQLTHTQLEQEMDDVRRFITEGLALRAQAQLKVRQPIASVTMPDINDQYTPIVLEELNAKSLLKGSEVAIDTKITPRLKREGLMREVIRHVQSARKEAGLQVDDRISLGLETQDKELQKAIDEHIETIKGETLTKQIVENVGGFETTVKVESAELQIFIEKI
jgi:isoleucyl-tRNA synthetase